MVSMDDSETAWQDYIKEAELLVDRGYVTDKTVEELAKMIHKKKEEQSSS